MRHLVDKVPVSELCEELGLRPTVFYRWQKELFEGGGQAGARSKRLWRSGPAAGDRQARLGGHQSLPGLSSSPLPRRPWRVSMRSLEKMLER